jgi:hypothetical protein
MAPALRWASRRFDAPSEERLERAKGLVLMAGAAMLEIREESPDCQRCCLRDGRGEPLEPPSVCRERGFGPPADLLCQQETLHGFREGGEHWLFRPVLERVKRLKPAWGLNWRARGDLNPRPLAPQANALSTELRARADDTGHRRAPAANLHSIRSSGGRLPCLWIVLIDHRDARPLYSTT